MRARDPCFHWLLGATLALACARRPDDARPPTDTRGPASLGTTLEAAPEEAPRERRSRTPAVHVDGAPVAVLAYLELPETLPTRWKKLRTGRLVRRFLVAELLESLGLDLAAVKQIHLHGGRDRRSIIEGAELRRMRSELSFSFTRGDSGGPRIHYPDEAMDVRGRVDLLDDVAVYVRREPPRSEGKYRSLTFADGRPIEGIPYAAGERPGGTRIHVDGALRAFVKRKELPSSLLLPDGLDSGAARFSLPGYMRTLGIPMSSLRTLEVLGRSEVLACLDAAALAAMPSLAFTLPKRSQGLLALELAGVTEPVQAIAIHTVAAPPDRPPRGAPDGPPGRPGREAVVARRRTGCGGAEAAPR